jgi:3-phosphoshikimate 1-carboxyvinyltransferase
VSFTYALGGSKSFSNRALVLAAVSRFPVEVCNLSPSDDSELLLCALAETGIRFTIEGGTLKFNPESSKVVSGEYAIPVGPAGTTSRFLTALFACIPGLAVTLTGSPRLHQRPIAPLVDALRSLGADIEYLGLDGCLPLRIVGKELAGGVVEIDGSVSSQFLTALLLVSGLLTSPLELVPRGELVSRSYLEMTISTMSAFGYECATSERDGYIVRKPETESAIRYTIEGDATGATYLFNLAMLGGGRVRVYNLSRYSVQGDLAYLDALEQMGASVLSGTDTNGDWIEVIGSDVIKPIEIDMEQMPDAAQSLAVVAACAPGTSRLTGLSTLRVKETDRINAVCLELQRMGIQAHDNGRSDELVILGGHPTAARIKTYDDHRMAMAFAGLALRCEGIEIEEPEVVNKSFPQYWDMLTSAGFSLKTFSALKEGE